MLEDITQWLDKLGLAKYAAAFAENDVDARALVALSEQDLKDLGVSLGHRRILQQAIRALADEQAPLAVARRPQPAADSDVDSSFAAWQRHPGERKPVTVLFADITGSTALTEHLDAEDAHDLLDGAMQRICTAVEGHQGTVCQVMGDGVKAMFGAPVASEHHAVEACEAALAMQHAIRDYSIQIKNHNESGLAIRVGLHSGEVVVLTVGDGEKREYDASGPTVPIAARMEQVAEQGEIFLTAATQRLAGGRIQTEALAPVRVKGVSEPLSVFVLRTVKSVDEAVISDARTTFVGRRGELNQFRGILNTCLEEARGQTVYIRGEPGIGKTRLVGEFTMLAAKLGMSTHRGLVLPFGVSQGQDAIRSLVRSLLGIAPGADEAARQQAAQAALDKGWLSLTQSVFLYDLMDLPLAVEHRAVYDAMNNDARNAGKQTVVSVLVAAASEHQPLLVVIEDLHWADPLTLAHLSTLAKTVAECRALLVMTSRIEADPLDRQWLSGIDVSSFVTIELGPLRHEDSVSMIAEFMEKTDVMAVRCLERAAGNPLFLEQLLRTAQESSSANLPESIQSLVLARIDRLPPQDKEALQVASVIGHRFDMDVLLGLLEWQDYDCRTLVEHNLVRREGSAYLFGHALIQEGVYGSLLSRKRRSLHRRAANWFAARDKTLYAQHLAKADDERAPNAYLEAAREQVEQYRYDVALRRIERGLELAPPGAERHHLTCLKAKLLLDLGQVDASMAGFREAEEQAVDEHMLLDAWLGLASCLRVTADYQGALELLEKSESVAVQRNLVVELSRLHHLRGNLYFQLGNIDGCREAHQRALECARTAGSSEDEARALGGLGDAEYGRGRMKSAYDAFRICVDRCRTFGYGQIEVANLTQMAAAQAYTGDSKEALANGLHAVQAASMVAHERAEMVALFVVGHLAYSLADVEQMESAIRRGQALNAKLNTRVFESAWTYMSALAFHLRGERERACEVLEPAIQNESAHAFFGPFVFGALSMAAGDKDTRSHALKQGERLLAQGAMGAACLQFYRFAIEGCLAAGEWAAVDAYAQALEGFTRAEPLPLSDFFVARGRALSQVGRGMRPDVLMHELNSLRDDAERMGLKIALPALNNAIRTL